MNDAFDAIVVGGSTVGAAVALALSRLGLDVALVDRTAHQPQDPAAPLDPRVVAVSPGSRALLRELQAWGEIPAERLAPFDRMQVVSGGGRVEFSAGDHGLDALGWIAEIPALNTALWRVIERSRRIRVFAPAEIASIVTIESDAAPAKLTLGNGDRIEARMLVGADGATSAVRRAAGIATTVDHYNQRAVVAPLETECPNPGLAWQRFTTVGPLALLPLPGGASSLVWSVHESEAERLTGLDPEAFIAELNEHAIDPPCGAIVSTGDRHALPLVRRQSSRFAHGAVALVGDAARSVHPLAGQGLNLGLTDVASLLEHLARSRDNPSSAFERYGRRRYSDAALVAGGIHWINESRSLGTAGRLAFGAGFAALARSRPARGLFVRRAGGLHEVAGGIRVLHGE